MAEQGLTIKKAAEYINENPSTLRNWARDLGPYMHIKKGENGYRYFDDEALAVLKLIKNYIREQHYTVKQVEYFLATGKQPGELEKTENFEQETTEIIIEALYKMNDKLNRLEENQKEIIKKLEENQDEPEAEKLEEPGEEKKSGFFKRFFK